MKEFDDSLVFNEIKSLIKDCTTRVLLNTIMLANNELLRRFENNTLQDNQ